MEYIKRRIKYTHSIRLLNNIYLSLSLYYFATFSSEQEAENQGEYYLNDVMYFGEIEITNYSVQPVYRNDHSVAYYGLNLWSNGQLIQ